MISHCMRKYEGRLVGILGAVIIHLVAGIIFMLVQMGSLNINEYTKEYQIALESIPEPDKKDISNELKAISIEQVLGVIDEMLNIARNLANQPDIKINAGDYIDKVKDELIESGKLGKDNYIDEQKKLNEQSIEAISLENKDKSKTEEDKPKESQQMAANYGRPTRIYYNLSGRNHAYLPIPIYKCEGSGKVVLSIEVNPKGIVTAPQLM